MERDTIISSLADMNHDELVSLCYRMESSLRHIKQSLKEADEEKQNSIRTHMELKIHLDSLMENDFVSIREPRYQIYLKTDEPFQGKPYIKLSEYPYRGVDAPKGLVAVKGIESDFEEEEDEMQNDSSSHTCDSTIDKKPITFVIEATVIMDVPPYNGERDVVTVSPIETVVDAVERLAEKWNMEFSLKQKLTEHLVKIEHREKRFPIYCTIHLCALH